MKIRTGFVSNSSSSSFIIRGIKISRSDILSLLGHEEESELDDYEISREIEGKIKCISCRSDDYYFEYDKKPAKEFIVGMSQGSLEVGFMLNFQTQMTRRLEYCCRSLVSI